MNEAKVSAGVTALTTALSTADFGGILDGITGSLQYVIPVIVGCLAVRKGISFVIGQLRRA